MPDIPIDDGLGRNRPAPSRTARLLWVVATAETITLTILLVNIGALGNDHGVARAVGPVHGTLYLLGVLFTWAGPFTPRLKLLAVVPVLGAFAAARSSRGRNVRRGAPAETVEGCDRSAGGGHR